MSRARRSLRFAALSLALGALVAAPRAPFPGPARASVPTGVPVFSAPLVVDNSYSPFQPGAVKVFSGRSDGAPTTVVDVYLSGTRDFAWGPGTVSCRILQETEFESGFLVEISRNYFAQADDGSVYYFGEIVDTYEDGLVVGHGGSWLVGGPSGGDPPETATVADPALFMPAAPEAGDEYMPEDVPDGPQERDRVLRADRAVKTPAGRFVNCLQVLETDVADGSKEQKWYGPGVGVLRAKAKGEDLILVATTLR